MFAVINFNENRQNKSAGLEKRRDESWAYLFFTVIGFDFINNSFYVLSWKIALWNIIDCHSVWKIGNIFDIFMKTFQVFKFFIFHLKRSKHSNVNNNEAHTKKRFEGHIDSFTLITLVFYAFYEFRRFFHVQVKQFSRFFHKQTKERKIFSVFISLSVNVTIAWRKMFSVQKKSFHQ